MMMCDKICDGVCPENAECPWVKELEDHDFEFAFYYWSSRQNREEDPEGYKHWLDSLKKDI